MTIRNSLNIPGYSDGIDVSRVQRIDDAKALRAAGFSFAFIKTSEALTYCDPRALEHLSRCRDAGMMVGGYGFARPGLGHPREQARAAVDTCAGSIHLVRPALDLELAPPEMTSRALLDFSIEWLAEARAQGCLPVNYSYESFLRQRFTDADRATFLSLAPLWLARYRSVTSSWAPASAAELPRPVLLPPELARQLVSRDPWTLLQYSGDGGYHVPGIGQVTDRNLFAGDLDELRVFFGLPPEGTEIDMGGPVHGTDAVDTALEDRKLGPFS